VTATIRWSGTGTAVSSIAHGGQQLDTTTLLRREKMLLADGRIDYVPVISGNTLRVAGCAASARTCSGSSCATTGSCL
jgi:hypothetical protein